MLAFGNFSDYQDGLTNYFPTDLIVFVLMGIGGGLLGAFFNLCHMKLSKWRTNYGFVGTNYKRVLEVCFISFLMASFGIIFSLLWGCTDLPTDTSDWTNYERDLLNELVQLNCNDVQYNQVASLYLVDSATAMQQLFHFKEFDGTTYETFSTGALVLFTLPYFLLATFSPGLLSPVGLFVPTLLSGAGFGRIIGHILNVSFPGQVADSGSYALMGAAAVLGGVSRATVAATIIIVEACGNGTYLLPLMLVFMAARYSGNAINHGIYDIMIDLKDLPHLEGTVPHVGLIAYQPVNDYMSKKIVTLDHIALVSTIRDVLSNTKHNGFPVVNETGHLCGFILRKHLTILISMRCFSYPAEGGISVSGGGQMGDEKILKTAKPVEHSIFERNYPRYPKIENIQINASDLSDNVWVDLRPYMDTSPFNISTSASVSKAYRFFRTLGLRHIVVLDDDHKPVGIITRHDLRKERLMEKGLRSDSLKAFSSLPALPSAVVNLRQRRLVKTVAPPGSGAGSNSV